jgi:sigma-E factor negative regulatory protein RseA
MKPFNPPTEAVPADAPAAVREQMSSLADGTLAGAGAELSAALAAWRDDVDARHAWHSYHLIGDVMRSDDLAPEPGRDLAFLNRLRERLDAEPVHVEIAAAAAPSRLSGFLPARARPVAHPAAVMPTRPAWGSPWRGGAALAASVAVATVVLLVGRAGAPGAGADVPAVASSDAPTVAALPASLDGAAVLRDPRLDEFLRLHQMARGGLPMGAPGGTLQRADLQMPVSSGR